MQKPNLLLFLLMCFACFSAMASHNRSGQITYKRVQPYTKIVNGQTYEAYWYSITVEMFTDDNTQPVGSPYPNLIQDRCVDTLYFGDGDRGWADRNNGGSPLCSNCQPCGCPNCGELIVNTNGYRVKKNIYVFLHEYPGPGTYTMRTTDPNRNAGVVNMSHSDQQAFYLESVLVINSFTGPNNSPEFTVDPIDKACLNKCFTHNPGAYDSDHDSLSFKLTTPKSGPNTPVIGYSNPSVQPGGIFSINPTSGILTWCNPINVGEYNVAFIVQEWRKNTSGTYEIIGSVLRDMQIVVHACVNNDPPIVVVPQDTCVEAGTVLHKKIKVSDPDPNDIVTITGYGGAFSASAPQAVLSNTVGGASGFLADFIWQTTCDHIAEQPYLTTFKAEDNAGDSKLADFNVYNIRVVPPSVKNVTASPTGSNIKISWSLSACNPTSNPLTAYRIYRQAGCAPYVSQPCKKGISPSSSFIYIGATDANTSFFVDDNNGSGLVVGQDYSYLVVAAYQDGSESFASSQVCTKLKRNVPVLLKVDVLSTSATNGSARISWTRPVRNAANLDTVTIPGPYRFDLKYKAGANYVTVFSSSAQYVSQLDTSFDHTSINTTMDTLDYLVEFTAGNGLKVGDSQDARSVFLSALGSDRAVTLNWKIKTPWKNYQYTVFRKAPGSNSYTAIGTTTANSFTDKNSIANRHTYCYYVLSEGNYSDLSIYRPLQNRSQEVCVIPIDQTAPCTPTLSIDADCPSGLVTVSWKNVRPICSDDVIQYLLFYKPTVDGTYSQVLATDTTYYVYDGLSSFSGCYAIQARDSAGNVSMLSPDFCIDNCPEFELPNVFSPNKDGVNDFYKAVKVRQVKEIDLSIVDRWGNLIYTTHDPYFEWDGISQLTRQAVSEGTFFYVCTVYEHRVKGVVTRVLKGDVQVVR